MTPKLVVDASVAAKWVFPEQDSDRALGVLDRYQHGSLRLLAPEHFLAEIANLAWKKATLQGLIRASEAVQALRGVLGVCPTLTPISVLSEPALALALAHRRSVYDCLYVALAWEEQCDLVTADSSLVRALNVAWVVSLSAWKPHSTG